MVAAPSIIFFSIVSILMLTINPVWLSLALFGERSFFLSLFIIVYLFIALLSRFLVLIHRMSEDGMRYALSFLLAKFTFITALCIAYFKSSTGLLELLGAHGASVSVGLIYLIATTRSQWSKIRLSLWDWQLLRTILPFGIPMATAGLLFWGLEGLDKLMLRSFSSFDELGIYSIALSIAAIASVATSMFTTIWVPVAYRWTAENRDLSRINTVTRHTLAGTVLLIGITGTFSWILEFILPVSQHVVQHLITACMLWPLFYALSETTGLGIAITRATQLGLAIAAVTLTVNVALNLILLPNFGSRGGATALAISIWIFLILRTEVSHRIWRQQPRLELYIWSLFALSLSITQALTGSDMKNIMFLCWITFLLTSLVSFRKSIFQAWSLSQVALLRWRKQPSC